jgi:hypothetical protein
MRLKRRLDDEGPQRLEVAVEDRMKRAPKRSAGPKSH